MTDALLLIDHGSRRAAANTLLETIADDLRRHRPDQLVVIAHLELAEPNIAAGVAACVAAGATRVVAVPFFLGPGRHTQEDIPREVAAAAAEHGVAATVAEPLAPSDLLVSLLFARYDDASS